MWDTVSFARAHKTCGEIFENVQGLSIEQYERLENAKRDWNAGPDHFTDKWKQLAVGDTVVRAYASWHYSFYIWWRVESIERYLAPNNYLCSRFELRKIPRCLLDDHPVLELSTSGVVPSMFLKFNGNDISRDIIWVVPSGSENSLLK